MSTFFTITQAEPSISFPIVPIISGIDQIQLDLNSTSYARNGELIIISGNQFKNNIVAISGESIYNSSENFVRYGKYKTNISGINNTLYEDVVGFNISGITPSSYKIYVYNEYGKSSNYFNLKVLDKPFISGFDKKSGLPGDYVRVSGYNFSPFANISFVDKNNSIVTPSFQETGLYKIINTEIQDYGTGYKINDIFNFSGFKPFASNTFARFQVTTTGINGSLGSLDILNSGIFTVPNLTTGIEFIPINGNGRGALINFEYEKYYNTGRLEFLEFQIPYNIRKDQSGILENLKFNGIKSGAIFDGFYISGYPSITTIAPTTGLIDSTRIFISGDNLSFANNLKIGDLVINTFNRVGETGINFLVPNFSSTDYVYVSGIYGQDKSPNLLTVTYPPVIASGFNPNDILAGTGSIITISGRYLQRINYINLGQPNVLRKDIGVNNIGTLASFKLPDKYITSEIKIFSIDFPNSGTLVNAPASNNLLLSSTPLSSDQINIRYTSGIEGAKYLDEIELYTSTGVSGNYGNLSNSDVFFLGITGSIDAPYAYLISGIKIQNSPTGIRFKLPREIKNPNSRIKIKRNKFGDEYILPSNKSIDVLPTIFNTTNSNTLYSNLGYLRISGINASNINLIYFSGYTGTKTILGQKSLNYFPLEIINKDSIQITGTNFLGNYENLTTGYTVIEAKLGGDITGSGEIFLFNNYFDTGIGYEDRIISNSNIKVNSISGFRPPNSEIFTSPGYITTPLDQAFFYQITTNSRATRFEISSSLIDGVTEGPWPLGIERYLNTSNQIFGQPTGDGGIYFIKIRALDGERPDEGMLLNLHIGSSGRTLSGPGITYRGNWETGIGYVGSNLRRDVVKYFKDGNNFWYAGYTNIDSEPKAGNPNWVPFTNEFSTTATKVLLVEESSITNSLNIGEQGQPRGYIKSVNDLNPDLGSGFYLGYENRGLQPNGIPIDPRPKFRVGTLENYIKFDGLGLDIVGPMSGIITTSKDITNSNNIVASEASIALGSNNLVSKGNDNVFIFGTNNLITGSRRSSIVAGRDNVISSVQRFFSDNSTIGGGEKNLLVGSYCNIAGGYKNIIDATSTGLSAVANQMFITPITGQNPRNIFYPTEVFTNNLGLIANIRSLEDDYHLISIKEISTTDYDLNIYPDDTNSNARIFSWVSLYSDNLYSGSFINPNAVCEFKVDRASIISNQENFTIPFKTPFKNYNNNNQIVVLDFLVGEEARYTRLNNVNKNQFQVSLSSPITGSGILNYFVGGTGFFTGVDLNLGKSIEIRKSQPFNNIISGRDTIFNINPPRGQIHFCEVYKPNKHEYYFTNISGSGNLVLNLSQEISDNIEYLYLNTLSYTGQINPTPTIPIQVYQRFIPSGDTLYWIPLLSNVINAAYTPIIDIIQTGNIIENYYSLGISGKAQNGFFIFSSEPIKNDLILNVAAYTYGFTNHDNCNILSNFITISGSGNYVDIPFSTTLLDKPIVFSSIECLNRQHNYLSNLEHVERTGFHLELSNNLVTGDQIRINYVAFSNTGSNAMTILERKLIDSNRLKIQKGIHFDLEDNFNYGELKIFGRAYDNSKTYLHKISYTDNNSFEITISGGLNVQNLPSFSYDYIASDLDYDKNIAKVNLDEYSYARLASFGFEDIGSSAIAGGTGNYIKGLVSNINGGVLNRIVGDFNAIAGGRNNFIADEDPSRYPRSVFCTVLGGSNNYVTGNVQYSNVIGGSGNGLINLTKDGILGYSSILGGASNEISGTFCTVLGGENNSITGLYSHALGRNINVTRNGTIAFSDSTNTSKQFNRPDTMFVHFSGGLCITGFAQNNAPLVLDIGRLATASSQVPVGGVYREGEFLKIRLF